MRAFLLRPFRPLYEMVRYQFGLKVVSVLIAATLWVLVFGSRTIEITKEVPFEVLLNDDQIIVDPIPEKITFRLSGPKAFFRSITNRIDDPIRANLRDFKTGNFTHRIFSDSIKLPLGVKVLSINPNVVQVRVEELKRKSIAVKLEFTGALPEGHRLVKTEILPAQLKIKGPKNRIQGMNVISTVPVDLGVFHETTVVPLAFDFKALGVDPDSTLPELNVEVQGHGPVYRVKHVPLKVKTTGKATVDDEEVTVIFRTEPNEPLKMDGDEITATIDVRDSPSGEFQKWVRVQVPERLHVVRVIPASTRVVVKGQ